MARTGYRPGGLLIRHVPESRRHRLARRRTLALALIATVAAGGVVAREATHSRAAPTVDVATAEARPFDYFPG